MILTFVCIILTKYTTTGVHITKKAIKMKKILFTVLFALGITSAAFAADTQFKVYDVNMVLKTTKAGGSYVTPCGETVYYRTPKAFKVKGVIAGCGCLAAKGDPTCQNFVAYFWDETSKTQLTNYTFETKVLQRIDKGSFKVEQLVLFTVTDQEGELFELQLAGFGNYKEGKLGVDFDVINTSGKVTGLKDAPLLVKLGSCTACSVTPDTVNQTTALAVCDCECTESDTADVTVVEGTYTMKYNASKSKNCEKRGVSKLTLKTPSYVNL